ncbi:MAG: prolipoprotein diacylglyceryl transferase [Actinobacteria bacterium]|nr:prolipoprotein diacylglyceryl transferase [Actinomycetota bacterium]
MSMIAAIPSPSSNRLGPFTAYGLMIATGVVLGVWLARNRWRDRGGDPEDISTIALWAVPAGLIGARLYHVITDNQLYFREGKNPWEAFAIWNGGLGIPGGIVVGVGVGLFVAYKKGLRLPPGLDTVAPALPLAQAIGRLGNWFNQELYGRPTELPWGLQISCRVRESTEYNCNAYPADTTFQPTFLYESLWNLALVGLLLWLDKKRVIRPGRLFAVYIGGYFLGRLWVESLRSDSANLIFGLRVNIWTSVLAIAGAILVLLIGGVRRRPGDSDEPYRDGHRFVPPEASPEIEAEQQTPAAAPDASPEPASDDHRRDAEQT